MNQKINNGGNLDWNAFKNLSDQYKDDDSFDIYDLVSFHSFFNNLYNRSCNKGQHAVTTNHGNPETNVLESKFADDLNKEISVDEISSCIKKCKNNKSVSRDLISNEMLKSSGNQMILLLQKLFNSCLKEGIYPWNCSITTPLHKKGDRQNPDNYRAITVGSCLGKLFSSILLKRLLEFRALACPDVPNQLGFRSGAQCSDHILTLSTTIEKYVHHEKRRVFACFVDYRKAFDSVCRDALLFKLSHMGITGNFFSCMKNMYSNSSTRIKLVKKLSAAIDVTIGTEQGHPMSPELFKIFIHDLSVQLDSIEGLDVPLMDGLKISHLLWADDLVLLALDAASLQKLLDCLNNYADQWELSVNLGKTNVMVFNKSSRILN